MIINFLLNSIFDGFLIFPEIIHYAGWSVAIGIIITIAFVGLLFSIIRGFYPKSTFSPASIIVGVILGILLCLQFIPLYASFALKGQIGHFETWISESIIHTENYPIPVPITTEKSTEIIHRAIEEYPTFGTIIGSGEFTGFNTSNLAPAIAQELNSYLNRIITKLLIIAFLETAICAFLIVHTQVKRMRQRVQRRTEIRRSKNLRRRTPSRPDIRR